MLEILQARLQQYMNHELSDVQAGFQKGRTRHQIANIHWTIEKAREFQIHINFCFIDYAKAFVNHNKLENSSRDENTIPSDWPPEKSVCRSRSNSQNQIRNRLVPKWERSTPRLYIVTCLFNLNAEYIRRNAGLDEAQAGIKIAGRNINNLRYADDTTLIAESEELKSLLMKVKEESEKAGLKSFKQ